MAVALQLALAWLAWHPAPRLLWGDEATYLAAAERLASGQPMNLELLWPPLYPSLLAPALVWFGAAWPIQVLQVALLGLAAFSLARFSTHAGVEPSVARLAGLLLLLDLPVAAFAQFYWPEIPHLAFFLGGLALIAGPDGRLARLSAGVLFGLALLSKSLLGPFLPAILGLASLAQPSTEARPRLGAARLGAARSGWCVLGLLVVITPTLVANRARYGELTLANSAWFNAWVGLNDRSTRNLVGEIVGDEMGRYQTCAPSPGARAAIYRGRVRELIHERGLASVLSDQLGRQYFRLFDKDSFFTDMLPGGAIAARGFGYRGQPTVLTTVLRGYCYLFYAAILGLAAAGLALTDWRAWRRQPWQLLLPGFVLYNLALFLVLHVKTRYRVQFEPFLLIYAATALVRWADVVALRHRATRAACAVATAGLLWFLAFGGAWLR